MDYQKLLSIFKKNSIEIKLKRRRTKDLQIGISKFGGCPDLPKDFQWYYYEGEGYNGDIKNRPLSFLAQINLEEIKLYDKDNSLPDRGMLYFFYELETMTWGFDEKDYQSARVYYYNGDMSKLKPRNFPQDLNEDYRLNEFLMKFESKWDMPDYEELDELIDSENSQEVDIFGDYDEEYMDKYDIYVVFKEKLKSLDSLDDESIKNMIDELDELEKQYFRGEINYYDYLNDIVEDKTELHKLLGYADVIQGSMLQECEDITSKLQGKINSKQENSCESKKWRLLFQIDSDENTGLMFGDSGSIYFYIKEDDLQTCNFDNVWCILQCY